MGKLYNPCDFIFSLENIDLNGVSSDTIYFLKNDISRIAATVFIDQDYGIVHIKPNAMIEELVEYKIVFSDALHFKNGHKFSKSFYIRFKVKDGAAYSPNVFDRDLDYFSPKNRLRFSLLMSVYFNENENASENLSFTTEELPDLVNKELLKPLTSIKQGALSKINALIAISIILFAVVFLLYMFY